MADSETGPCDPDFSDLPTMVWVNILSRLDLKTRYRVSVTCPKLNEAFHHPTLWSRVTLNVTGNMTNYGWVKQAVVPARNTQLVKHFGKYFQNLTIVISGYLDDDFGNWNDLITEVGNKCRLESLKLRVGTATSVFHYEGKRSCSRNLIPLVNFIKNAFRLKKLHIVSWPMYPRNLENIDENIFEAAMLNPKLKELEELSLFCSDASDWTERQPILLQPNDTTNLVNHFCNLRHLALRSPMVDHDLLKALSTRGRQSLQRLHILVNYISEEEAFQIPEIPDKIWEEFSLRNVGVQVALTILSKVPLMELSNLLKPACPMHFLTFMAYSSCDGATVQYITDKYKRTLTGFESHRADVELERELVNLVEDSPNLRNLLYFGKISCSNVERLAELRSTAWTNFQVLRSSVYVEDEDNIEDRFSEDEVVVKTAEGNYVMVSMLKKQLREQKELNAENRKLEMVSRVSELLGYKWTPTLKKPKFS